jgi:MFS family permease
MPDTRYINRQDEAAGNSRWRILIAAAFTYLIYAVVIFNIPPILGILIDLLKISHTQAGFLISIAVFPSILLSFPSGLLVDRYGTRITGAAALGVVILGTVLVALGGNYWVLLIGRLILGLGATLLVVAVPKIITVWFADREIGLAMGIYHTAFPLGNILVLNFAGLLAYSVGWQAPIWVCAALSAAALVLYIVLIRDKKSELPLTGKSSNIFKSVKEAGWEMWCLGLTWGLFGAGTISYFTYAPDYFVSSGKDVVQAGLISSAPMFGSIILATVVGMMIDRAGKKWLFVVTGLVGVTLTLFLIPILMGYALMLAIFMGVFIAMFTPALFSLPGEIFPARVQGIAFGIILTCQGLGNVVGPIISGFFRDLSGDYFWSFIGMCSMIILGVIPMVILQIFHKKKTQPAQ